jgi:hypothetical protein
MSKACAHCGAPFASPQAGAIFCSRKCKTDAANLAATRGKQLYHLAYGWRTGKGGKFSDLSWLVDQFIKEYREAGRAPPVKSPLANGTSAGYLTAKALRDAGGKEARKRKLEEAT